MMEIARRQMQQGKFWKKYLRLTRAGVTTLRAFEILHEEEQDESFQRVIARLQAAMEEGMMLSEAMTSLGDTFSRSCVELIHTAEKGGQWDLAVEELADGLLEGTFD